MKSEGGAGLIEILVAVAVFAVLGMVTTQSVTLTLRGSKKSESQVRVRENVNYALSVIERQLRNANSISVCPNSNTSTISYTDTRGVLSSFSCAGMSGPAAYVASGSARLTGNEITITACSFVCSAGTSISPPSVTVSLGARESSAVGTEGASVTSSTKIHLRTY